MGLFTAYLLHKHGKRAGVREQRERDAVELSVICDNCGYTRAQHSRDERALCPRYDN